MSYSKVVSPNQGPHRSESDPYADRLARLRLAYGYMRDSVRRQTEQTVHGEVSTVHNSFKSQHPAAAMAFKEVPTYPTTPVLDVSTARASVIEAHGDGRRPAEEVQAPSYDLSRQFLQQNPSVNTNNGYRPGESTNGSV